MSHAIPTRDDDIAGIVMTVVVKGNIDPTQEWDLSAALGHQTKIHSWRPMWPLEIDAAFGEGGYARRTVILEDEEVPA